MTKPKMKTEVEIRRRIAKLQIKEMNVSRKSKEWYNIQIAVNNLRWVLGGL